MATSNAGSRDTNTDADVDTRVADAHLAGVAWVDEADADADDSPSDCRLSENDVANVWDTDHNLGSASSLPPRSATADAAANAWSSSSSDADPHQLDVPFVTPSRITLPRRYSASDFGYVDSSWLPTQPASEGESSADDGEDFFD